MTQFIVLTIGGSDLLVIILLVVLLFGSSKIPQLMKGLGEGIKEFKKASKLDDEPHQDKTMADSK